MQSSRVNMGVDSKFFDLFESERKRTKEKLGLPKLSQRQFSKMIAKKSRRLIEIC